MCLDDVGAGTCRPGFDGEHLSSAYCYIYELEDIELIMDWHDGKYHLADLPFNNAEDSCQNLGGHLATIPSAEVNNFLGHYLLNGDSGWIGLKRMGKLSDLL